MTQKSHIWNSFLENIISGTQSFYICPDVPVDIIRVFFNFRFSRGKSQSQQKLTKKITRFIQYSFAQKTSLILRISTHLLLKTICPCNTTKNLSDFTNFQQTCLLHHFLTPKNCILEAY